MMGETEESDIQAPLCSISRSQHYPKEPSRDLGQHPLPCPPFPKPVTLGKLFSLRIDFPLLCKRAANWIPERIKGGKGEHLTQRLLGKMVAQAGAWCSSTVMGD